MLIRFVTFGNETETGVMELEVLGTQAVEENYVEYIKAIKESDIIVINGDTYDLEDIKFVTDCPCCGESYIDVCVVKA